MARLTRLCEAFRIWYRYGSCTRMSSMNVLLKRTVEACCEARMMVEVFSGRFAEQGVGNPTDLVLAVSILRLLVVKTGEWPEYCVMQWYSKTCCVVDTCRFQHCLFPRVILSYDRNLTTYRVTRATTRMLHPAPHSCLNTSSKTQGTISSFA